MSWLRWKWLAGAGLFLVISLSPGFAADTTADLLRSKDQALLDAIAPGDRKDGPAGVSGEFQ